MNRRSRTFATWLSAAFASVILLVAPWAKAEVFALGSGSALDLAGTFSATINYTSPFSLTLTGSGPLTASTPGSLHTELIGTLDATRVGNTLNFIGGSNIRFANPDALAFDINVPLTGAPPGAPALSLQLHGKIHDVVFDVTGSAQLSGSPGSESFNTLNLNLVTTAGTFDGSLTACTPTCGSPMSFSKSMADPINPDTLPAGIGTLSANGTPLTISLPIDVSDQVSDKRSFNDQGFAGNATIALDGALRGSITASIPEPAIVVLIPIGIAALLLVRRRLL